MNHRDYAKVYGIKIDYTSSSRENGTWDGEKFNARDLGEVVLLHEIAHWLVSDEERRHMMDFGLGPGPETNMYVYYKYYSDHPDLKEIEIYNGSEETLTCVMEFILGAISGMDMIKYLNDRYFTFYQSGQNLPLKWEDKDQFDKCITQLKDKKIINDDWVPIQCITMLEEHHYQRLAKFKALVE